jgi:hypothetical protein
MIGSNFNVLVWWACAREWTPNRSLTLCRVCDCMFLLCSKKPETCIYIYNSKIFQMRASMEPKSLNTWGWMLTTMARQFLNTVLTQNLRQSRGKNEIHWNPMTPSFTASNFRLVKRCKEMLTHTVCVCQGKMFPRQTNLGMDRCACILGRFESVSELHGHLPDPASLCSKM